MYIHLHLYLYISSAQSFSHVQLFATPWTAAHQASLSITNSQSLLKLMSIESVMPSNHLILYCPLLLPPSIIHSIRVFSKESVLHIRSCKYNCWFMIIVLFKVIDKIWRECSKVMLDISLTSLSYFLPKWHQHLGWWLKIYSYWIFRGHQVVKRYLLHLKKKWIWSYFKRPWQSCGIKRSFAGKF